MKKIILLLFIFIYGAIQAQIIDFPDENLKNALLNHNPIIDTNNNGEIEISEAVSYNSSQGLKLFHKNISNATGIEYFTNTEKINLTSNNLTNINLSIMPWIEELYIRSNPLSNLDLSNNLVLEILSLGNDNISSLDISNNIALKNLAIRDNGISSLDISNNLELEGLFIDTIPILEIDTSNNHALENLTILNNDISTIDTSYNLNLKTLWLNHINITELNISNNTLLWGLDISYNSLQEIDLSNVNLTYLAIAETDILQQSFLNETDLTYLNINNTEIDNLDLTIYPDLTQLEMVNTLIPSIDLSQNIDLQHLWMKSNLITDIDVTTNINIEFLRIESPILSLDLSNNTVLKSLRTVNTNLTTLDLSQNEEICSFSAINNNELTFINFRNNNNILIDDNTFCSLSYTSTSPATVFTVLNNNNLAFICVDDINYALEKFNIQDGATLIDNCGDTGDDFNQLTGQVTYDEGDDGCDPNDQPISSIIHSTDGINDFASIAAPTGGYNLHVYEGTYDTQIIGLPDYFITDPIIYQNTFTGFNQTETVDFCITATEAVSDLSVTLMPTSQARPGFESSYQIVYSNIGTTTVSGTIDFDFNEALVGFQLSDPSPANATVNSISWDFENLLPFTSRTIDITMLVEQPPVVEGDDILQYTTSIAPSDSDVTPNDNTFELNQVVVNSYDPNDKTCLEGEEVLIENADEYLHYLIRFQNTGTASAINVRVADQLDEKLDWTTLVIESLSHSGRTEIQNGRDVSFIFDDIYLPHEAADPEGSNGFIAYKIKPKEDVVLGDTIENTAYIFFDFNPPIITNTTETTFVETLTVDDVPTITVEVYPNPTSDVLYINSNESLEKLTIYNSLGQSIRAEDVEGINSQIDMSNLDTGIYFISLQTISGSSKYKQIIKK